MSHFNVLVIGDNIEEQLAPYHEFESTGTIDRYVIEVNCTEEARERFEKDTETRIKDPAGNLLSPFGKDGNYLPSFCKSDEHGRREFYIPEGFEKVEIPSKELISFADWTKSYYGYETVAHNETPYLESTHKYGFIRLNAAGEVTGVIRRTNPNAQWDWYVVGGRWSGWLKAKPGVPCNVAPRSRGFNDLSKVQERGTDAARKGDIDFEGMRKAASDEATADWDAVAAIMGNETFDSWETVSARHPENLAAARKEYHAQPVLKKLREKHDNPFMDFDQFLVPREKFIQAAFDRAVSPFAIVKEGKWYQRGKMGWWGIVSDEKDQDAWNRQVNELLDGLPNDTMLTVVDCHI